MSTGRDADDAGAFERAGSWRMPRLPEMRDASTGTPTLTASEMTFAPPSMIELTTVTWLAASQRSARACGTLPTHL